MDDARSGSEWRRGWPLVMTAMAGYSLSSLHAASTGVMMGPIERELGWTRTEIYSGASLVSFIGVALATLVGLGIDRLGARRIGIAVTVMICAAIALMGTTGDSLWGWWARWALVGIAVSAMPTVWIAPVAASFTAARGLAVSIALSGSGIATFVVPIVAHALVEAYGWRTAFVGLGAIWAAIVLPLVLLFFHTGPRNGRAQAAARPDPASLPGLTAAQGFRSRRFYTLLFAGALSTMGGVALVLNLVPVLNSTGIGGSSAATVAGLIGISTIVGRVAGGWLTDRMNAKVIAAVATLLASALPGALLFAPGSILAAALGVIAYGLCGGAKIGALVYLASRHLGQRAFGTLYGAINAAIALAVGIAPLGANMIYDATKSYAPVMWAAVPVLAVAAVLYLSLPGYPRFGEEPASA
jgi:MFS family permease